jgi:small subunit ribosomal protein S20
VANIRSQIKRNRQTVKRHARNKSVRSELRTRSKRAIAAIESDAEDRDEAAAKGVIHKNQAANRKARIMRRAAAAPAED